MNPIRITLPAIRLSACPHSPSRHRLIESVEAQSTVTPPLSMPLMVLPKAEAK